MTEMIRRIFITLINTVNMAVGTRPTSADGAAAAPVTLTANVAGWTFGAWVQMVAAADVTADEHIIGISFENFTGLVAAGEVEIGTGAALAEVARARVPTAASYIPLPRLRIPANTRVSCRYRTANAATDTVAAKLVRATGV